MKLKRTMAIALSFVMLLGASLTCYAVNHDFQADKEKKVCYGSMPGTSHSYVSRVEINPITGERTNVYSTCYVVVNQYRAPYECTICHATNGNYYYWSEYVHSACGQTN